MGATESSADKTNFQYDFGKRYGFLKEITDKRFGEVQIYKNKTEDRYIAKRSKLCDNPDDLQNYYNQANKRKRLNHQNIISILHFEDSNQEEGIYCGDFNKLSIFFEYFFLDLEKEIARRRLTTEYLTESELWYLLDSLISAGNYLEKHQIYHGDYKPSNILLTSEGQVKIGDHGLLHIDQSSYYKMYANRDQCFLSPSLMEALKDKDPNPSHDYWKSDIFSLAMTVLEVADLAPPFFCYDFKNNFISQQKINEALQHANDRYGEFFVGILRDMLQFDENLRPCFEDVHQVLLPYQSNIHSFTKFTGPIVTSNVQFATVGSRVHQSTINPGTQILQTSKVVGNQVLPQYTVIQNSPSRVVQQSPGQIYGSQVITQQQPVIIQQSQQPIQTSQFVQVQPIYQQQQQQLQQNNGSQNDLDNKVNQAIQNSEQTLQQYGQQQYLQSQVQYQQQPQIIQVSPSKPAVSQFSYVNQPQSQIIYQAVPLQQSNVVYSPLKTVIVQQPVQQQNVQYPQQRQ